VFFVDFASDLLKIPEMDTHVACLWTLTGISFGVLVLTTPLQRRSAWRRAQAAIETLRSRLVGGNAPSDDAAIAAAMAAAEGDDEEADALHEREMAEALALSAETGQQEEQRRQRALQRAKSEKQAADEHEADRVKAIPVLQRLRQANPVQKKAKPKPRRSVYENELQSAIHGLQHEQNVLKLLLTVVQAVQTNPDQPKYRRLSLQNRHFKEQLAGEGGERTAEQAKAVLRLLGFSPVGQTQLVLRQVSPSHLAFGCSCLLLQLTLDASAKDYASHFERKSALTRSKLSPEPAFGAAGTTKLTIRLALVSMQQQANAQTNAPTQTAPAAAGSAGGGGAEDEGAIGAGGDGSSSSSGGHIKLVRHFDSDCRLRSVIDFIRSHKLADTYFHLGRAGAGARAASAGRAQAETEAETEAGGSAAGAWTVYDATTFPHKQLFLGTDARRAQALREGNGNGNGMGLMEAREREQQLTLDQTLHALGLWPSAQLVVGRGVM
jgi:hypothetical protein